MIWYLNVLLFFKQETIIKLKILIDLRIVGCF